MSPEQAERLVKVLTGHPARNFSVCFTIALAFYISLNAWTLANTERAVFGAALLDYAYLATAATLSGIWYVLHIHDEKALKVWLVLLTASTFGRGVSLLVNGSEVLNRASEVKGAMAWILLWGGGVIAALLLNAYSLLWGSPRARARLDLGGYDDGP